jgi:hemerythrin superfamily protein
MATLMQKLTNPLAMLKADHAYVKQAFTRWWETDSITARRLLVQEICDNLTIHATLEEDLFYPALEQFGGQEGRQFVEEATREHQDIKNHINEVLHTDVQSSDFRMKLRALEDLVLAHAEREEALFPMAEDRLPLRRLAKQMDMRRLQLMVKIRPPSGLGIVALVLIGLGAVLFVALRRQER